jgi:flagellar biosynthetic protein FliP
MRKWMRLLRPVTVLVTALYLTVPTRAAEVSPGLSIQIGDSPDSLKILFAITILALAPSILIMMTGFTRIIIVLSCARNAVGLQQTPPNQVLVGLALFLTLFLMNPVISQINEQAYTPYTKGRSPSRRPSTGPRPASDLYAQADKK